MPYYRLFYHAIWTTKNRFPCITMENRDVLFATMTAKINDEQGMVHAINGMEDHVHIVMTLPPSVKLSEMIAKMKGSSSFVARRLPNADPNFVWQAEYGILSVSESQLLMVVDYVRRQQEHHANKTLNKLLETVT